MYIAWKIMEAQITVLEDGRLKFKNFLLEELSKQSKKFFECDAFIACCVLDPRITWSRNGDLFNSTLLERGVVSSKSYCTKIPKILICFLFQ
jgi:hypothetical protein